MAQIRGTAGYQLGNQNPFGGSSKDAGSDPSPLDAIREQTSKIEDFLDSFSEPIKPYVNRPIRHPLLHQECKALSWNLWGRPANVCIIVDTYQPLGVS